MLVIFEDPDEHIHDISIAFTLAVTAIASYSCGGFKELVAQV